MNKLGTWLEALAGGAKEAVNGSLTKVAEIIDEYKLTEEEIAKAEVEYEAELTKRLH